ncbi:uncharacterized protein [Solanum tuberosum]|uniref:uncharacterized protein n=1 Tax=Solanum tuberosum TaxID=4113 RepID=UPI00073A0DA5|nr:PREDICTED: uncharacterized protein LOC107058280 [Solanum tuberosum]
MKTDAIVEQLEVPNNEVDIGDDNELEHTTDTISIHNKGDISPRLLAKAKKDEGRFQIEVQLDMEQLISFKLTNNDDGQELQVTIVYASTDRQTRIALWDDLHDIAANMSLPWVVGGNFNVITDEEEKYGGLPVQYNETEDFVHCINTCQLVDLGFKGSIYTWWNGRSDTTCIFKRLDRCLGNQALQISFPNLEVEHLIIQGSDHYRLILTTRTDMRHIRKSFRFLNFWVEHETFQQVVADNWQESYSSDPFFNFHNKLKKALTEKDFKRGYKIIEDWLDIEEDITREAIRFYTDQFTESNLNIDFEMLECIPKMITEDQNAQIHEMPDEEEVKNVVFGLNSDSTGGPDVYGYTGEFYQACWNIIAKDMTKMVQSFFCGHELPRYITCTNLALIPKKKDITTFSDMRPVSLSNFTSKVFSRIIHERLVKFLPTLISPQQSGLVKGRSIVENVLLVQEIVHDIRIR